ncbi:hypothetical protein O974_21685 [Mycobacterium avium 11-0986]|nr:hypothetical protein O974_21685 [Mycobacterium avium 11-0986]
MTNNTTPATDRAAIQARVRRRLRRALVGMFSYWQSAWTQRRDARALLHALHGTGSP